MHIIFCDTNKLFGALRHFVEHGRLGSSAFLLLHNNGHEVYISQYVIHELMHVCKKRDVTLDQGITTILDFCDHTHIRVIASKDTLDPSPRSKYAYDEGDIQIVKDASSIDAQFLVTSNTKDFDMLAIAQDFEMYVVSYLPGFLLKK